MYFLDQLFDESFKTTSEKIEKKTFGLIARNLLGYESFVAPLDQTTDMTREDTASFVSRNHEDGEII